MKNKFKTYIDILFLLTIFLYIFLSTIKSIFKPKDTLSYENRYANKFEDISLKKYLNGELQDNIENTFGDQVILTSTYKNFNNFLELFMIKQYTKLYFSNHNCDYFYFNKINLYGSDYLVYTPSDLSSNKSKLDRLINNYNNLIEKYNNLDFYLYYIETDNDIDFRNNSKSGIYEYINSNIFNIKTKKMEIKNFNEYTNYFTKTDHHWNYKGSRKGYEDVVGLLNLGKLKDIPSIKCITDSYGGSKSFSTILGYIFKESFCFYNYDFDNTYISLNGKEENYGNQEDFIFDSNFKKVSYGNVYGWDDGEIIFKSNDSTKDNILIFGNSFDNAILKLLANKFNMVVSIDLRNYKNDMKKEFDFDYYVKNYDIDEVLFIGDYTFFTSEKFLINTGEED